MTDPRRELQSRAASAGWLSWPQLREIFAALTVDGATVRAVGGAVRDTLLGRKVSEVDLAIDTGPETVLELARRAGIKAVATGLDHGTVTLVSDGRAFEVTTLRADVETDGRHARVEYTGDWEGDARRRDFTINALYMDADGTLLDPLGGLADIEQRRIRFIGDAGERIREDYLRILRFFRFVSELEPRTLDAEALAACARERGGLKQLAAERIRQELVRLLMGPDAMRALQAMFDHGLLIDILGGVPMLSRLSRLVDIESGLGRTPDPMMRLNALAVWVPEDASRLAGRLRLSRTEVATLGAANRYGALSRGMGEEAAKAALYRGGADYWLACVLQAWASSGDDAGDVEWRALFNLPGRWTAPEFPLDGKDIIALGVSPGRQVGETLGKLEAAWIDSGFAMGRDDLLRRAEKELAGD